MAWIKGFFVCKGITENSGWILDDYHIHPVGSLRNLNLSWLCMHSYVVRPCLGYWRSKEARSMCQPPWWLRTYTVTLYLRHQCSLPILTFLLRVASGLKLIAEWLECQMSVHLEVPSTFSPGPCFKLACQASSWRSLLVSLRRDTPPSILSSTQPHSTSLLALHISVNFDSPNPRR